MAKQQQPVDEALVKRLDRDLARAAATLTADEARFLVDYYYLCQEDRKRAHSQESALQKSGEPHAIIDWLGDQASTIENQIKRALDIYTDANALGAWAKAHVGIGPVIAAGLLAHIDITRSQTVGQIWRFAGLDPTSEWKPKTRRPWNAQLRALCWKMGMSFLKLSGNKSCYYGQVYKERKAYEIARNDRGDMALTAARALEQRNYGKDTDTYKHYAAGHLPPAQIDARARRYAVKLFLSHYHGAAYRIVLGCEPPLPYPIAHLGHVSMIDSPVPSTRRAA